MGTGGIIKKWVFPESVSRDKKLLTEECEKGRIFIMVNMGKDRNSTARGVTGRFFLSPGIRQIYT